VRQFGDIVARTIVDEQTVGAEKLLVGLASYPAGARIDEHLHPDAEEVVFLLSGSAVHIIDGRRFEMQAGEFCFIPAGATHAFEASPAGEVKILWAYGGAASYEQAGLVLPE
jgi:quercetin dioxygenase-like cupin family protein